MHNSGALRAAGRKHAFDEYECATLSAVIVRESGRSSIPETLMIESKGRSVLDTPHARGMTAQCVRRGVSLFRRRTHRRTAGRPVQVGDRYKRANP